jgi:hypothetical protein
MNEWRVRRALRRRARRRYLAVVYERWRTAPERPSQHGQPGQVLVTLLWLLAPGVLAAACATLLWLIQDGAPPSDVRPAFGALLVPLLVVWLVRGALRR